MSDTGEEVGIDPAFLLILSVVCLVFFTRHDLFGVPLRWAFLVWPWREKIILERAYGGALGGRSFLSIPYGC